MKDKLIYLATPYSKYESGLSMAFVDAARLTARLLKEGYKVYSPIAHTHPIAVYGNVDPYDHDIWMPFDQAMMDVSDILVIATFPGWEKSKGISIEIEVFKKAGKTICFLDPNDLMFSVYQ